MLAVIEQPALSSFAPDRLRHRETIRQPRHRSRWSANHAPFSSVACNIDLNEKNVAVNEWQRRSEQFNFAREDAIPDMEFNVVLWYGLKGDKIPMPAPRRAAFFKVKEEKDED